jgi:hypothetical protein
VYAAIAKFLSHCEAYVYNLYQMTRVVDEGLLGVVRGLPCLVCLTVPVDAHHVSSVGAGGGDTWDNVMPLCREHHQQWHSRGPGFMMKSYPTIRYWLEGAGREDVFARVLRK